VIPLAAWHKTVKSVIFSQQYIKADQQGEEHMVPEP